MFMATTFMAFNFISLHLAAQKGEADLPASGTSGKHLFIDVHQLEPGKVTYKAVAAAHAKDVSIEKKYGVQFLKYWVDEKRGLVYCLSAANDSSSIRKTHAEAHGLLPSYIYEVTDGQEAASAKQRTFFLDVHELGPGKVKAKDVAKAHKKDLEVEEKYSVNFINYWVDEKKGVVICLSQANDSESIIRTHKEAHGLLPSYILKVKQGE